MHLGLTALLFSWAIWKGDWRNWRKYILTIQYVVACNLLYNFLCKNYLLWQYKADFLPDKHYLIDLFYTFINLPSVTLLYLTFYPYKEQKQKQVKYIAYWVIGSLMVEIPFLLFDRLFLKHGYEYWMDAIFYFFMYSFIRLHYSKQLLTYGMSAVIIVFLVWYFKVPLK
ncbi:MAG TPA: CBO0543 family protein [Pseudoneobacillus sp.]|nr:CBO0543 family protein [Pseudoneobacillus sp.]